MKLRSTGRVSNAMEINLTAIDFFKNTSDSLSLAKIYRAQRVAHAGSKNFLTAEDYFKKAFRIFNKFVAIRLTWGWFWWIRQASTSKSLNLYEAQSLLGRQWNVWKAKSKILPPQQVHLRRNPFVQRRSLHRSHWDAEGDSHDSNLSINDLYGGINRHPIGTRKSIPGFG